MKSKRQKLSQKERRQLIEENLGIGEILWEKFEAGIYNYCDRWCEKCSKTKRCFLYFMEERDKKVSEDDSAIEIVTKSLTRTKTLIEKIAEAEGHDLKITKKDEKEFEKREAFADPDNNPLVVEALEIFKLLADFLQKNKKRGGDKLDDAFEKLSWHHTFLYPKTARAVSSKLESQYEKGKDFKKISLDDSQKSAWVAYRAAMICIDSLDTLWPCLEGIETRKLVARIKKFIQQLEVVAFRVWVGDNILNNRIDGRLLL